MTLKEKFKERLYNQSHDDSECLRIKFENIDKVIDSQEKLADEFAIGFLKWYVQECSQNGIEYLLQEYKKEQGL